MFKPNYRIWFHIMHYMPSVMIKIECENKLHFNMMKELLEKQSNIIIDFAYKIEKESK